MPKKLIELPETLTVTPREMLAEIDRELAMRARVYPGLIRSGRLTYSAAAQYEGRLQAARHVIAIVYADELAAPTVASVQATFDEMFPVDA